MPERPRNQRVTTSFKVNPDLWKEIKIEAIRQDMEVSDALSEAIEDWINKRKK